MDSKVTDSIIADQTVESDPSRWKIPWYELIEEIPSNSICHVYRARRKGFEQNFLVKVLKTQFASDAQSKKRFELAAKKVAGINQANLVPIYDHGYTGDGLPYFVSDFVDDVSLSTIIRERGGLEDDEAIDIFIQICDALNTAHAAALLHHNLKPGNVFITKSADKAAIVKITDIGIIKVPPTITMKIFQTTTCDEPSDARYMSPEQCRGEKLDARADVYSLGCLMYHTLGGKPPHRGSNSVFTALKQIEKHPVPLSQRFPELDISLALENVVMRALNKDRETRYQTIADLQQDLKAIQEAAETARLRTRTLAPFSSTSHMRERSFARLYLAAVFVIAICITYSNHTLNQHDAGTANVAETSIAESMQQSESSASENQNTSINQANDSTWKLVNVYSDDGKKIFTGYGAGFGDVLERAVRSDVDLTNANLKGQNLAGLNLANGKFRDADFSNADLTGTNFYRANLDNAQFSSCTINGANLDHATLRNSIFTDSDLSDTRFYAASLCNSYFRDCNLDRANLSAANFAGANVFQIEMPDATMTGTSGLFVHKRFPERTANFVLTSTDGRRLYKSPTMLTFKQTVEEAIKNGISLRDANLRAADLSDANLANADLRNADLRGALLNNARLNNTDITGARAVGVCLNESAEELQKSGAIGWQALVAEPKAVAEETNLSITNSPKSFATTGTVPEPRPN